MNARILKKVKKFFRNYMPEKGFLIKFKKSF